MSTTTTPSESLQRKFSRLAGRWTDETAHVSLASRRAMHPAYQRIIGIGPDAILLILKELQRKPDDWFWALNAITEADPVPEDCHGDLQKMANAWVEWGRLEGFIE